MTRRWTLKTRYTLRRSTASIIRFDWKQINFELLRCDLEKSDLIHLVIQSQKLNDSIVVYNVILGTILEKHALLVERYIKTSKTPW